MQALRYIVEQIHTVVAATTDGNGEPVTEPTGRAMITKGYNLPCSYVIHTVGPIISGRLQKKD